MALLRIKQLSVKFGGLLALNDLNLELMPGHIHGLIGPNGAGKTTVFNVITRIYKADVGSISLLDRDVLALQPHEVAAAGIARTFQNIELFPSLSVLDNVLAGNHVHVRYGIFKLANSLAASLPFGQQRLLELARAVAVRPKLLLLDEPAAGMNTRESSDLNDLLMRIRKEFSIAILLVEHDMRVVMNICDRVTVMQYGQKIFEGTPDEVRTNPRVIEAYLGTRTSNVAY
jgi:branched-chain amino acid transport system ATP-binding protein